MKNSVNAATVTDAAAQDNAADTSVATLPAPSTTTAPAATAVEVKRVRKPRAKGKGQVAPAAERAELVQQDGNAVTAAAIEKLDDIAANDVNLRSPEVKPEDRKVSKETALMVAMQVGLGNKSGGAGPMIRSDIAWAMKGVLNKKTLKREDFTAASLTVLLSLPDCQDRLRKAHTEHLAELEKHEVTDDTKVARGKQAAFASKWIEAGMHASYLTGIQVLVNLGGQVQFGKIAMPLDRALGVAFGRNITAAELVGHLKADQATPATPVQA
jgi:hypothetical protein